MADITVILLPVMVLGKLVVVYCYCYPVTMS